MWLPSPEPNVVGRQQATYVAESRQLIRGPDGSQTYVPTWPARFAKSFIATFAVLGLRNYRYFWLSNATADLGVELRIVATAWLTLQLTGSPFWVGFIASLPVLPALFFSMFGGL